MGFALEKKEKKTDRDFTKYRILLDIYLTNRRPFLLYSYSNRPTA